MTNMPEPANYRSRPSTQGSPNEGAIKIAASTYAKAVGLNYTVHASIIEEGMRQAIEAYESVHPSPTQQELIGKLEAIVGTLQPVATQDWHGKWRIQRAIELASEISQHLAADKMLQTACTNGESMGYGGTGRATALPAEHQPADVVERVARAICEAEGWNPDEQEPSNESQTCFVSRWRAFVHTARCAIRALQGCEISLLNPDMPAQELRLHMGEMSAQEERTVRAAIRWANTRQHKPVVVSLEQCAKAVPMACSTVGRYDYVHHKHIAKAVLDAAGVKYGN